jgi:ferric-dicitrate binding protein FerR (iron transport regulator)
MSWRGSQREERAVAVVMAEMNEDEKERRRRQRMRSLAIALALGAMVALFYVATIIRLGGNVFNRPI